MSIEHRFVHVNFLKQRCLTIEPRFVSMYLPYRITHECNILHPPRKHAHEELHSPPPHSCRAAADWPGGVWGGSWRRVLLWSHFDIGYTILNIYSYQLYGYLLIYILLTYAYMNMYLYIPRYSRVNMHILESSAALRASLINSLIYNLYR